MGKANRYFYILLATFVVAIVGLAQLFTKMFPLLFANTIHLCEKTLSNFSIILPSSLPITIISAVLFIFLIGVLAISFQAWRTRLYIAKNLNKRIPANSHLKDIFESLNLENKVDVVKDDDVIAYSYGLFKPRICISNGLVKKLSSDELKAVLLHESYHIKNLDPLKIVLSKTASFMFFFLPIIYDFQRNYALSKEIAADRTAIEHGEKESLLAVLTKLLTMPSPRFSGVVALAGIDTLEARILHLTAQNKHSKIRILKRNVVFSLAVMFLGILVLNAPIHAFTNSNMVMNAESNMSTYCVCPFGDSCMTLCIQDKKSSNEINVNKTLLYTPIK